MTTIKLKPGTLCRSLPFSASTIAAKRDIGIEANLFEQAKEYRKNHQVEARKKKDPKQTVSTNYVICPKSGLNYTVADDYAASWFTDSPHAVAANPDKLFHAIRKDGSNMPPSWIVAGILLKLDENELLQHTAKESKYCRGQINEQLCNRYEQHQLLALYWRVFNSKAAIKRRPLKLDLSSALTNTVESLFSQINSIALQELDSTDLPPSFSVIEANKRAEAKLSGILALRNGKTKLDIKSCMTRIDKHLGEIVKELETQNVLDESVTAYKYARSLYRTYLYLDANVKAMVINVFAELREKGIGYDVIPRDGTMDKTIEIVIKHMSTSTPSIPHTYTKDGIVLEDW